MTALTMQRQETFAGELNKERRLIEAATAAGYADDWKRAARRAAAPATLARVKALDGAPAKAATPQYPGPDTVRFRPLSDEDWIAKYAPKG